MLKNRTANRPIQDMQARGRELEPYRRVTPSLSAALRPREVEPISELVPSTLRRVTVTRPGEDEDDAPISERATPLEGFRALRARPLEAKIILAPDMIVTQRWPTSRQRAVTQPSLRRVKQRRRLLVVGALALALGAGLGLRWSFAHYRQGERAAHLEGAPDSTDGRQLQAAEVTAGVTTPVTVVPITEPVPRPSGPAAAVPAAPSGADEATPNTAPSRPAGDDSHSKEPPARAPGPKSRANGAAPESRLNLKSPWL